MRNSHLVGAALLLAIALAVPGVAAAQRASEESSISQSISGTVIQMDYSRPSIRRRETIFGGTVSWGELWTAGANASTIIRFSKDVQLNGHKVPAGAYGVWLQPNEDTEWMFVLHPDTTLFHVPHPPIEEGFLALPIEQYEVTSFLETLRWDFQTVRLTGAQLQMHWGHTQVSIDLAVDPGFLMTMPPELGRPYVGEWSLQRVRSDPEAEPAAPRTIDLSYDDTTRQLGGVQYSPGGDGFDFVLLPRAEGIFTAGYLLEGEVASSSPNYWEFTFEQGEPSSFVVRNADDDVVSRGTRVGS